MTLRMHPDAQAEMRGAANAYNANRVGLGDEFLAECEAAMAGIEQMPLSYGRLETLPKETTIRRCILRRFPYLVIFKVYEHELVVIAVAHTSRRPNYWRLRQ